MWSGSRYESIEVDLDDSGGRGDRSWLQQEYDLH